MLTPEQIAHFETFGFLILRQVFTRDEADEIKRNAQEIFEEDRGGKPFSGEESEYVQPFFERKPFLTQIVDDDRIYDIGVDLLRPDFILDQTEGRFRVGETAWHGTLSEQNAVRHAKINFYVDPLTKDTGCLRPVPGSHRASHRDASADPDARPFGVAASEIPCYPAETEPGDVVIFTENTLHASFGGQPGRHQHAIVFMANPKTDEEVAYIRGLYGQWKYGLRPSEVFINSDRPRLRRMVSRLVEWGFEPTKA